MKKFMRKLQRNCRHEYELRKIELWCEVTMNPVYSSSLTNPVQHDQRETINLRFNGSFIELPLTRINLKDY